MPPSPWFYLREGRPVGPVTAQQLKQLADSGQLGPDDQVWQEGMKHRVAARVVRGLFPSAPPDETGALPVAELATAAAATSEAVAAAPATESAAVIVEDDASPAEGLAALLQTEPAATPRPAVRAAPMQDAARSAPPDHYLEGLIGVGRRFFQAGLADSAARLFFLCGHYGLYAVMALTAVFAGILAVAQGKAATAVWGLAGVALLAVLHYTAARAVRALHRALRAVPAAMSSTTALDCLALAGLLTGMLALIWLTMDGIQHRAYWQILVAMGVFTLCQFMCIVALDPYCVNIAINPSVPVVYDGLGVAWFVLRAVAKAAAVVYGLGVAWAAARLLFALSLAFAPPTDSGAWAAAVEHEARLTDSAEPAAQGLQELLRTVPARQTATAAVVAAAVAAGFPLAVYLLWYLPLQIVLEVVRGWIPGPPRAARSGGDPAG